MATNTTTFNYSIIEGDDLQMHFGYILKADGSKIDTASDGELTAVFEGDSGANRFEATDENFNRLDDMSFVLLVKRTTPGLAALTAGAKLRYQVKYRHTVDDIKITPYEGVLTIEESVD